MGTIDEKPKKRARSLINSLAKIYFRQECSKVSHNTSTHSIDLLWWKHAEFRWGNGEAIERGVANEENLDRARENEVNQREASS